VKHAYKMYLSQQTYYRVSALDTRLGGAEQRLTDDLSELASSVAHLYSSLTKPLLDCALVGIALISFSHKMGAKTIPGKTFFLFFFPFTLCCSVIAAITLHRNAYYFHRHLCRYCHQSLLIIHYCYCY